MYLALNLSRKVEVDIGGFVSFEAEERLKRDIVTVSYHIYIAMRTFFRRQIKARTYRAVGNELVMTALRTTVMGA